MNEVFPICHLENRKIDGFDLIGVLGLMKEYNWKEIWRRYQPADLQSDTISMYVLAERYFMEMHVQKMHRIILSEKFNTNPFFMQQVIQRIIASHDHDLILAKIKKQGIDTGENPISLACSMGNTIVDFVANKNDPFPPLGDRKIGSSLVETEENRPIDIYDLSSTLYLCQQNLTNAIYRRYGLKSENGEYRPEVNLLTKVGDYQVDLTFQRMTLVDESTIPQPANISVATMHQILQRMNFRHANALILKELANVGVDLLEDKLDTEFSLCRFINNTALKLNFRRIAGT
jgi:hypothetical protein